MHSALPLPIITENSTVAIWQRKWEPNSSGLHNRPSVHHEHYETGRLQATAQLAFRVVCLWLLTVVTSCKKSIINNSKHIFIPFLPTTVSYDTTAVVSASAHPPAIRTMLADSSPPNTAYTDAPYCTLLQLRNETRLLPNLRPTTGKCVHLVTCGHILSHDKDSGHTIRFAIVENPMLHAKFMALCFTEPELIANRSFALCHKFWKLSDRHKYIHTNRTKLIHHATYRVVNNCK